VATLPAHTRNYFTRANMPLGSPANNTTQVYIESYYVWNLVHVLTNQLTTGTTGGTRHANSIWICRGSSNASTFSAITSPGVAGTNHWYNGGTFPGAFTRGAVGTPHHWILLENVFSGYELMINFSQNAGYLCMNLAKTGTHQNTGNSTSQFPPASPTNASMQLQKAGYNSVTDGGQSPIFGDTTNFGNTNYNHITLADNGDFLFFMSRAGLGCFTSFVGVWTTTGAQTGDVHNTVVISGDSTASGRGTPGAGFLSGNSFMGYRSPNGTTGTNGGVITYITSGTQVVMGQGIDGVSGSYNSAPLDVISLSPQYARRGQLTDIYQVGTAAVGNAIPNSAAQLRTIVGDIIVPFISVIPLI